MKNSTNKMRSLLIISISVVIAVTIFFCTSKKDAGGEKVKHNSIMLEEFIYEIVDAPTPECHASTIADVNGILVAAWFGGTKEKNNDVGIWVSHKENDSWSKPVEVVNGVQEDGTRYPCWNPVLFQPKEGPLMLFYKIGPDPEEWWGMLVTSEDCGKTWSAPKQLPNGILGPIKNKPVQLANGELLCPASTEHDGWEIQIESTNDLGENWNTTGSLNDGKKIGAIQPTILTYPEGRLQILCRTENGFISECWSEDNGKTWGEMTATPLLNPNSGIDGITLKDGRQLLVYNPTGGDWGARVPLSIAISIDGNKWERILDLEPVTNPDTVDDEEYSYPGVIQTPDGKVHIVYTYNRKTVKHMVLDQKKLN
jgi:predicted neuraminidase